MITHEYKYVISELTGRRLITNLDPENYAIPPSWTRTGTRNAMRDFKSLWEEWLERPNAIRPDVARKSFQYWETRAFELVAPLGRANTPSEFGNALAIHLSEVAKVEGDRAGGVKRIWRHALLAFWHHGCLMFPRAAYSSELIPRMKRRGPPAPVFINHIRTFPLIPDIMDHASQMLSKRLRASADEVLAGWLLCLITGMQGVRQFSDLTPTTLPPVVAARNQPHWRMAHIMLRRAIISLQEEEGHKRYVEAELRPRITRASRLTNALSENADLQLWANEAQIWIEKYAPSKNNARVALGRFIAYLSENKNLPRNPIEYLAKKRPPAPLFEPKLSLDREVTKFLDYVLQKHCTAEDENGLPYLDPAYANPLSEISISKPRRGETHRQPMPTRIVHACISVLSENDFAWAKQWDNLDWLNPETGLYEKLWWPGRAAVLMVKLLNPARTAQIRWLDSGEADSFVYDPDAGWSANKGRLAPKPIKGRKRQQIVEKGVFRRYRRLDGSEGSLLYFNTNKTRDADSNSFGFVMPWENDRVIRILARTRDWQIKHNPIPAPLPWTEVREVTDAFIDARVRQMGSACFLFRDPINQEYGRWRPVAPHRVRRLWLHLQAEVERRLRASGEDITLIEKWTQDKPPQPQLAAFDLHSLRVTLITALYKAGVPAEVLMKVAGHASVLMTLYYTKFHPDEVTEQIAQAQRAAQQEWVGAMKTMPPEALSTALVFSHDSAPSAFKTAKQPGMNVMDHGICPVGMTRCHEGLVIETTTGANTFAPVPNGSANCTRCRFFMTGVPFLVGLAAHVNDLSYRARRLSKEYTSIKQKVEALENEQMQAAELGKAFAHHHALRLAATGSDAAMSKLDDALLSLADAIRLAKQCEALLSSGGSTGYNLVAVGGVEQINLVLQEVHELEQLQRICVNATIFDGLQIDWREANLRRARHFDRMLRDIGQDPVFVHLDEAAVKRVGDEFGRLLYNRASTADVAAVADGQVTLRQLGIEQIVVKKLEDLTSLKRVMIHKHIEGRSSISK